MPKKCPKCRVKRCSYGYANGIPEICCDCVEDEKMINLYVPKCNHPGCTLSASYGIKGGKSIKGLLVKCHSHADIGLHVPLTGRNCVNCGIKATYGIENSKNPIHCSSCADKSIEVRLINPRVCACGRRAYYRTKYTAGQPAILKRATHCGRCMTDAMESTIHFKCEFIDCGKRRKFIKGISSDFCEEHTIGKNILHCIQPNCLKLIISDSDKCIRHRSDKYYLTTPKVIKYSLKTALKYYLEQI